MNGLAAAWDSRTAGYLNSEDGSNNIVPSRVKKFSFS